MGKRVRTVARGDLEIDEDRVFQEKMWRAERVAWVGFGALALVALGGLTGQGGPLSRTVARAETGAIEYPRVTRWETSDEIVLTLAGGPGPGEVVVEVDEGFGRVFEVEDIQPAPDRSEALPHGQRLVFRLGQAGGGKVTVHVRALRPSLGARAEVRIDGRPLTLSPVVLP